MREAAAEAERRERERVAADAERRARQKAELISVNEDLKRNKAAREAAARQEEARARVSSLCGIVRVDRFTGPCPCSPPPASAGSLLPNLRLGALCHQYGVSDCCFAAPPRPHACCRLRLRRALRLRPPPPTAPWLGCATARWPPGAWWSSRWRTPAAGRWWVRGWPGKCRTQVIAGDLAMAGLCLERRLLRLLQPCVPLLTCRVPASWSSATVLLLPRTLMLCTCAPPHSPVSSGRRRVHVGGGAQNQPAAVGAGASHRGTAQAVCRAAVLSARFDAWRGRVEG